MAILCAFKASCARWHMNIRQSFSRSARMLSNTRALTLAAMLVALHIALSSVRVQITPELRLTVGYVTQAAAGMLLGPVVAMLTGAAGDIVSLICFPTGAYFPGYTLTAAVGGLIYGLVLFGRPRVSYLRALGAKAIVNVICNLFLNTLWLTMTSGQSMMALLPVRAIKNLALLPLEALLIYMTAGMVTVAARRLHLFRGSRE
jgi:ECF transporter S component (folate family)